MNTQWKANFVNVLFLVLIGCAERVVKVELPEAQDGTSCSVEQLEDMSIISCTDGTFAEVFNGQRGEQGEQGLPGVVIGDSIVQVIDPCGPTSSADEIILELTNGAFLAWYLDLGLVQLEAGKYKTTDSQQCKFDIVNDVLIERGFPTNKPNVNRYVRTLTGAAPSSGIQLTCIQDESVALNASKVRIRSSVTQNVKVRQNSSNEITVLVEAGFETLVTFDTPGTVVAEPQMLGSQQTKACNN